jgi:hypothetical protein
MPGQHGRRIPEVASTGVLLNVLKEELPAERKSRFWAFGLGAALYAAFLIVVAAVE